jgi:hypothetical protein
MLSSQDSIPIAFARLARLTQHYFVQRPAGSGEGLRVLRRNGELKTESNAAAYVLRRGEQLGPLFC